MSFKGDAANLGQPAGDPALKRSFKGHKDSVCKVAFNPNLKQVVSGSVDGTVMVWNFKASMRPFRFVGHKGPVYDVKVSQQGNVIASCSADHTIRLWNNSVEGHSQVIKSHSGPVRSVCFSNNGQLLLSGSDDKTLKIFQTSDRKFVFSIPQAHQNWIKSCQFSPDTRLIASGSDDRTVKLWDFNSRQQIHSFQDHCAGINSVKFHPDGTCVSSGSQDKSIKIWDIRSQRLIQHYDAHSADVNEIDFHPNGRYLLSSSSDSTLKIWDLRQGHILYTLYGHEGSSTSANFSPCGDYFTTGGSDSVVMVWKSNLDENEQEFIEDFGAKTGQNPQQMGGVPSVSQKRPPTAKRTPAPRTSKKATAVESPTKSQAPVTGRTAAVEQPMPVMAQDDGVGGSGEELAQTLEKVVSQLDIISRTLHVLEQRVSMNEESVANVMSYFQELKDQKAAQINGGDYRQMNMGYTQSQGNVINAYNMTNSGTASGGIQGSGAQLSFNQTAINDEMRRQLFQQQSSEANIGPVDQNSVGSTMRGVQQMPGTILSNEADLQRQTQHFNVEENDDRADMEDDDVNQQQEPQIQEGEDLNQRA